MFQAVILCGGTASRLYPLAEVQGKATLPVANFPLIYYQLKLLEKYGFRDVIVVTNDTQKERLKYFVDEIWRGPRADVIGVNEDLETADVLREISDKIHSDFFLLSGDLITDVILHHLADVHRINDAFVTVMLYPAVSASAAASATAPAKTDKADLGLIDFVGLNEKRNRLLYFSSAADVEEEIELPKKLLRRNANMTITNKYRDAHLYIFSKAVMDVLSAKKSLTSIKGELIPYLIRKQFSSTPLPGSASLEESTEALNDSFAPALRETDGQIYCATYIHDTGICFRVNTLAAYREANFQICHGDRSDVTPWEAPAKGSEFPPSQVGQDCLVGANATLGARSSVKRSIVGKDCRIGANVKIANSIVMDHVVIQDGVNISNCIICNHVHVQEKLTLKDSTVGCEMTVVADASKETLVREDD